MQTGLIGIWSVPYSKQGDINYYLDWYYLGTDGVMQTGWIKLDDNRWYYFGSDGRIVYGWKKISGKWYYFVPPTDTSAEALQHVKNGTPKENCYMVSGWKQIDGIWYYFKTDGSMAANEYCGGYWLGASGAWTYQHKAQWKKDSKGWYYQDSTGWYAKNCKLTIDGKEYNFNTAGYCTNP